MQENLTVSSWDQTCGVTREGCFWQASRGTVYRAASLCCVGICLLILQHAHKSRTLVSQSKIVRKLNVPAVTDGRDKKGRFC